MLVFSQIDLPPGQTHLLGGAFPNTDHECAMFEARILALGGIQLLVTDLGPAGQIGMNVPGQSLSSRTRLVALDESTQTLAAVSPSACFPCPSKEWEIGVDGEMRFGEMEVPTHGLTIGLGTILESSEIVILATGEAVAQGVRDSFGQGVNHLHPASALQLHPEVVGYIDVSAASRRSFAHSYPHPSPHRLSPFCLLQWIP